jgi:hypothetical protein
MDTTLVNVRVEELGSGLSADAAIAATSITVDDPIDFSEDGGALRLGDLDYDFTSCDQETGHVELDDGLAVAVVTGDPVQVLTATGTVAQEWVAEVEFADGDEVIEATIPTALIGYFTPPGEDDAGSSVSIADDGRGGYVVTARPGQAKELDGSMVVDTLTGNLIRTAEPPEPRIELGDDGSSEPLRVYTGDAAETNPAGLGSIVSAGRGGLSIGSPVFDHGQSSSLTLYSDTAGGPVGSASAILASAAINLTADLGVLINGLGRRLKGIDFGLQSSTTDASGNILVSHLLAAAPLAVVCTGGANGVNTYKLSCVARTSTTWTLRATNTLTQASAGSGVSIQAFWVALV